MLNLRNVLVRGDKVSKNISSPLNRCLGDTSAILTLAPSGAYTHIAANSQGDSAMRIPISMVCFPSFILQAQISTCSVLCLSRPPQSSTTACQGLSLIGEEQNRLLVRWYLLLQVGQSNVHVIVLIYVIHIVRFQFG